MADAQAIIFRELTVVGVLSASGGLEEAIERLASGTQDPRPLVAATVGLDEVGAVPGGRRNPGLGTRPEDPRGPAALTVPLGHSSAASTS